MFAQINNRGEKKKGGGEVSWFLSLVEPPFAQESPAKY